MKIEYLIIGQGIAGTFCSWYLQKAGHSFIVIDNANPSASSRVAAGIINPVTGRRIVETWMIGDLLPFAVEAYEAIGKQLGKKVINEKTLVDFFPSPQMLNAFNERMTESNDYLSLPELQDKFNQTFNYDFGYGEISPCYTVHLSTLLPAWADFLKNENKLYEEEFNIELLSLANNQIKYKNIIADKIIFCDGIQSARNTWFKNLPFALNKGEALVIKSPNIPADFIYKKGLTLVPADDDLFWAGSSHEWNFTDAQPSSLFYERTTNHLQQWLKTGFETIAHLSSIRPATVERRPFVGVHPHHPNICILNGMGTKGCSLAPYFADQLVNHLTKNSPILPEADISRFTRILKSSL